LALGGLSVRELAVRTWTKVDENEILTRAAAVAFYAMMALVPFLGVVLTITIGLLPDLRSPSGTEVGFFANMTVGELRETLRSFFPREAREVIEAQITRIQQHPPGGLISLGLAMTLWLASSLFVAIMDAMNRIYGVIETRSFLKRRLTAMLMTIVEAIILIGSLLAIAFPELVTWMGLSPPAAALVTAVQWIAVMVIVLLSFALCFYVGPDADQRWEWITPGSLAGTAAFLLISLGFRAYVQGFAKYDQTYGSLGGVMILMFWFWLSSVVLLTAAQINKLIEDASPLGRKVGQKTGTELTPDFEAMKPQAASS
jgi:membrane protein